MTTLAAMKNGDEDLRRAGYRRLRATTVLAAHTKHVRELQDQKFEKVLSRLREVNFSLDRLKNKEIEYLFAVMDEDMDSKIVGEFVFEPELGSIRDLGSCIGHCDLCGKGDSRDDGANEDKIRYQFRLKNRAGGDDVWVGSSCIVQHGLHVSGARTSEEAEKLLARTMQQHLALWKIEAWKAAHPDHAEIPEHWQRLRRSYLNHGDRAAFEALGFPFSKMKERLYHLVRGRGKATFRTASQFYSRKGFLTDSKTELWVEAKTILKALDKGWPLVREARSRFPYNEAAALDWLEERARQLREEKEERERLEKAARRLRRKPRKL